MRHSGCIKEGTMKRRFAMTIAAVAAVLAPTGAIAQGRFPDRPLQIIAPFATGGAADVLSRFLARQLEARLGQSVIVVKATMMASSSTDRTVDLGSLGPVGWSVTVPRFFHLATVFGLIPCRGQAAPQRSICLKRHALLAHNEPPPCDWPCAPRSSEARWVAG
jgi:hypothetical protein